MVRGSFRLLSVVAAAIVLLFALAIIASADAPANEHFQRTWARTDQQVRDGSVARTWIWGPEAFTGALQEPYSDTPGGQRTVQYFDKSRMEINHPDGDPASPFYVTNGLLVVELMSGNLQTGDDDFEPHDPATVNVAGDADDPNGPTYADLAPLRAAPPLADGAVITQRIDGNGVVTVDESLAGQNITAAYRLTVPGIDHQVASPFWEFLNSSGPVVVNDQAVTERLFDPWFYATGYPITEAYWADVKVAGTVRLVLLQCFERRCLTYTPGNPDGFLTEAGNVGQHYHTWRYEQIPGEGTPTATATASATATATATMTPTAPPEPVTDYTYVTRWGGQYTPLSPLNYSCGIAIDADDNFWVADGNSTSYVAQFDEHGRYLRNLGSAGSGTGQFLQPHDVAIAGNGDIYVADTGNNRIQKFNAEGVYQSAWGTLGTGNGQFKSPFGIAIHTGTVYVADTHNNRIQYFDLNGTYQGQFGSLGTGNGQLGTPIDMAFDAAGNVYVTESGNQRVQKFTSGGVFISTFGSSGSGDGQFSGPWGISIGADGTIYVADKNHQRVQLFDANGTYLTQWTDTSITAFSYPAAMAIDSHGDVYIGNLGGGSVQKFTADGTSLFQVRDTRRGRFSTLKDVTVDRDGNLLVIDTYVDKPTIARYTPDGIPLDDFDFAGAGVQPTDVPAGTVVNDAGETYVVNSTANLVMRFSPDWGNLGRWGELGSGPGQFNMPLDIVLDADGNVYVADSGNNRIQKFDADGVFLDQWGEFGSGDGQFNKLQSIAIHGDRLYAADFGNNRVQVFDLSGEYISQWGSAGMEAGQLSFPSGIATDALGYVLVVEHGNNRVQIFTPDGESVGMFGSGGSGPGQLSGPLAITLDSDGYAYVTDLGNYSVHKFAPAP